MIPLKNRIKLWTFFSSKSGHCLKKNWSFFRHKSQISFQYLMIFQTREVPNTQQNMVENNKCGKCKKTYTFWNQKCSQWIIWFKVRFPFGKFHWVLKDWRQVERDVFFILFSNQFLLKRYYSQKMKNKLVEPVWKFVNPFHVKIHFFGGNRFIIYTHL